MRFSPVFHNELSDRSLGTLSRIFCTWIWAFILLGRLEDSCELLIGVLSQFLTHYRRSAAVSYQ
jgi:hypothetical protein